LLLEEVAKLLPDDSYLTEFRIDKGKLQISGRTKDAASLLVLFGQSVDLSGARFFSPSSRTGDDGAETFHIEATINPRGGAKT
jgi:general secretion pathway protein L